MVIQSAAQLFTWADVLIGGRVYELFASKTPATRRQLPSRRVINSLGFAACLFMLGFAYYLQYNSGLQPCPLCIVQRLIVAILGITFLTAAIHNPGRRGARRYGVLLLLVAVTGAVAAGYQVWLQSLAQDTGAFCLPPLDYLLGSFPLTEAITMILKSPGGCGEIQWTFAGLSIPAWTGVAFAGLGATGIMHNQIRD